MSLKNDYLEIIDSCCRTRYGRRNREVHLYDSERDEINTQVDELFELMKKVKEAKLDIDAPILFESQVRAIIRRACHDPGSRGEANWQLHILCGGDPKPSMMEYIRIRE